MVILDEVKRRLSELAPEVTDLHDALAIERSRVRLEELEQKSASPEFYDDAAASGAVFAEMGELKDRLEQYAALQTMLEDAETLLEMCAEDDDPALAEEADAAVNSLDAKVEELRLVTLLNGEYDANNAILTFHAGAGGTEAQDWVEMLYRMYTRFAARHNWTVKVLDYLEGDEAGIKSASILVEGHDAYGFLRSENGVHRLVRVSPFDASGRRHTSFASLEVMPELDDAITVEIKPEDIKMEVFRSSGAGGQHINKTSSAVRLIHIPTGIVVSCQNERSQFQNRDMCMKMLAAKLYQIKEREHLDKISDIKGVQNAIAWGSQIRSYVFMPYTLVKDHRTGFENGNVNGVMDGDLDGFINAYLKMSSKGEL
ncbi:MAG TPA: peptide chain release factor 2 [Ruthenibacterium lactatiformans]|uniref:peptide chain release factor 2 n=1 Tax=Ruthenibacterium sp. TaxID=1905345 RepID=UPI000ED0878A|nr:peptide chain release factor 2 [Ruthenibacterium sp.]MBQ1358865.1 peptide chain release factor 2 [Ruthenibacterium sp.]HAG65173.1 peptide chain release factor 2 [Ruthenibacterium lactatiformans]